MHNGLDHPEIDMLKEQNETTEQESNLFTVMDEHIPSPPEIEAEDVLVLPEIQSMTDYIRLHFEEKLVEELSRRLRCGELLVPSGGRLYQELPWAGSEDDEEESVSDPGSPEPKDGVPADWEDPRFSAPGVRVAGVRPKKGAIIWFNYRRVAECGVETDLTLEMEIELRWYTLRKTVCPRYDVDMWFDMEEDIAADYGNFRFHRHRGEKPGVRLDDYLVPVFGWEDVEKEAEQIIFQIAPEGLQDPQWLHPGLFAERLGLRLLHLPLYRRPRTASILFFGPGEALTASEEDGDKAPPVPVQVEANTIVINSRCIGKERGAVFHECFHFMEHRLFFHLQRLRGSDVARLGQWKPVALEKNGRSPIEWIEWRAHGGGLCLQAPRTLLRKRIAEELNGMRHVRRHMGYKLELVGKKLAKEFGICNYQLRNRMIQVGYNEARGSLNFVGDGYIEPFATDPGACRGNQNFAISPKELLEEYVRNETFRRLIDTGRYIYADGHICLNDPEYVVQRGKKLLLTEWANAHVNRCCLRFVRTYHRDRQTHYVFGQLNSDEAYNGRSLAFSIESGAKNVLTQAKEISEVLLNLPCSFPGTLKAHMEQLDVTIELLAERSRLSVSTLNRLRNKQQERYKIDQVAAVCFGLRLQPEYSFDLLRKAGLGSLPTPRILVISGALPCLYKTGIDVVQTALKEHGCELKLNE